VWVNGEELDVKGEGLNIDFWAVAIGCSECNGSDIEAQAVQKENQEERDYRCS
jgi:hypothetical protein